MTSSLAQSTAPTDPGQLNTGGAADPSVPLVGSAGPGSDGPTDQPPPQTPVPGDDTADGLQPINAQQNKAEELKGPTVTLDFGTIQTGEKYTLRISFFTTKAGFDQEVAQINVAVGPKATVEQIVAAIKRELGAKNVPFSIDPKTPNVITFAWGKGGNNGGDLSKVIITLFTDKAPDGKPILNKKLDAPTFITGAPEVLVDNNGAFPSKLPPAPKPAPEEEESLSDDGGVASADELSLDSSDATPDSGTLDLLAPNSLPDPLAPIQV